MITFILLNYNNAKDTIECLNSLKKIKTKHRIASVVVDNNSSVKDDFDIIGKLCDQFIQLPENIGFAKGNNYGCKVAIAKYHPDFLVVVNNDTLITQKDFVDRIYHIYDETKFDALGPKIITNNGQSVNPFKAYETSDEVENEIKKCKKLISIYKNIILRNLLKFYFKIKYTFRKPYLQTNGNKRETNVALHGCAIIFSKKYYQKYKDIFYRNTFLYHEEEFLAYRQRKDNLTFVYEPSLEIFHKEGSSLNTTIKDNYQKKIFKEEKRLQSLLELERVIREDKQI